jgi:hypothetical protein
VCSNVSYLSFSKLRNIDLLEMLRAHLWIRFADFLFKYPLLRIWCHCTNLIECWYPASVHHCLVGVARPRVVSSTHGRGEKRQGILYAKHMQEVRHVVYGIAPPLPVRVEGVHDAASAGLTCRACSSIRRSA